MNLNQLVDISLRAGILLLCSGAEIYRVEDTVVRICSYYEIECECFVLPTGIFITVNDTKNSQVLTRVKRIKRRDVDLNKIEQVNSFSRQLECRCLSYREAMEELDRIDELPQYPFWMRILMAAVTAFVYTIIFEGTPKEGATAFFISIIIYIVLNKLDNLGLFHFFGYFAAGLIAGGLSVVSVHYLPNLSIYKVIIGSIMILVPGVAITNGMKDALYGDTTSSLLRLSEAFFVAAAVGAGVGVTLSLGLRWV